MSKRLEFYLVFFDKGDKGFYLIHNNELSPKPNLKKNDLQDYNLLYTIGTQIYQYIREKSGTDKIWSHTSASPKEFLKHTDSYTPISFFEDKNMHIQVYVSSKDNLRRICTDMTRYSKRSWYKSLCKRLGVTITASAFLLSGCALSPAPQEPLVIQDISDDVEFDLSEYIIQNYTHDVPYIAPLDNTSEDYVAFYYEDSELCKLIYGNRKEGIASIQSLYGEDAKNKMMELQKEVHYETST